MAAIKHQLQRELFLPNDERLFSVVHVTKEGKRKKACFLCAAVTIEKPVHVTLYQVKHFEKTDTYKKKQNWPLRQIRIFDAKYVDSDSSGLDVHADKVYKWVASSITEKNSFIQDIWRLSHMYLVQKPDFVNVQPGLLDEIMITHETDNSLIKSTAPSDQTGTSAGDSDWRALSEKEQSDLEALMSQCEYAISRADVFTDDLSRDLSLLDGENIQSIMSSEEKVLQLMMFLDDGLNAVEEIENTLQDYENIIGTVKSLMDTMKDKDFLISIRNRNHKKLLDELESLIQKLSFDNSHAKSLLDSDLTTTKGIQDCTVAAKAILKCHFADIKPALNKMAAVQDQKKKLNMLKNSFAKRLSHHLNNLFIHQGNEMGGVQLPSMNMLNELRLPSHTSCHRELMPYSDLMCWLKVVDQESFMKLKNVYATNLGKLFDQQVKDFIQHAKHHLSSYLGNRMDMKDASKRTSIITTPASSTLPRKVSRNNSSSSLNKSGDGAGPLDGSRLLLTPTLKPSRSSSQNIEMGVREVGEYFDQVFEKAISELEVWCAAEQDFCVKFFNLLDNSFLDDQTLQVNVKDGPWMQNQRSQIGERCKINENVRGVMADLFVSLESELMGLESYGVALNSYNILHMLVRMGDHVMSTEDAGSFLSKAFANCLVQIKRDFDRFVDSQIQAMREYKTNKKGKVGIISFVHTFEEFARHSERIYKDRSRRRDLDMSYNKLVDSLFVEIKRVAEESQKTPKEVVLFENYHRLFAILSELKIISLDGVKKEAKKRYQEWMQVYVVLYLGQPLEKVQAFFQGVESKVSTGMRLEDVGYQVQFNKQELKRIIKDYSGKEVKKGLDLLYKKVDKHLSEEESLLQVVWHSMQDEFIKQYKYYEHMIAKCYPDSGISFEFTINDLLSYFSDIAQSH